MCHETTGLEFDKTVFLKEIDGIAGVIGGFVCHILAKGALGDVNAAGQGAIFTLHTNTVRNQWSIKRSTVDSRELWRQKWRIDEAKA